MFSLLKQKRQEKYEPQAKRQRIATALDFPITYEALPETVKRTGFFTEQSYAKFLTAAQTIIELDQCSPEPALAFKFRSSDKLTHSINKYPTYTYPLEGIPGSIYCRAPKLSEDDVLSSAIYISLEKLGQGHNGRVKKVMDLMTGKQFALKITSSLYHPHPSQKDPEVTVLEELRLISDMFYLKHTHKEQKLAIATPYVDGVTLSDFLFEHPKSLTQASADEYQWLLFLTLSQKLLAAVQRLHEQYKILHCDIKGDNIIVGPHFLIARMKHETIDPRQLDVNIIDFGNSLLSTDRAFVPRSSYSIPEIDATMRKLMHERLEHKIQNKKIEALPYTAQSDLYCVGKTLKEVSLSLRHLLNKPQQANPNFYGSAAVKLIDKITAALPSDRGSVLNAKIDIEKIMMSIPALTHLSVTQTALEHQPSFTPLQRTHTTSFSSTSAEDGLTTNETLDDQDNTHEPLKQQASGGLRQ